jgi:hypothetical protein
MSRAIAFLALFAVLTLRFADGAAHADVHEHQPQTPAQTVAVVLDAHVDCGKNDFHGAAHCASHMADALQRSAARPLTVRLAVAETAPVVRDALGDGRILSPPVRPPLA